MRGTDELRKWGRATLADTSLLVRMEAIADRIDAEHEAKVSYWQGACYKDGYDEGFASADDWLAQHEDAMAEHGWYRALDADKQPIKFGEEVEHNGVVANVLGITFHGTTPPTVCIVRGDCWVEANECRHHRAPTVEDVLREMLDAWGELPSNATNEAIVAEYAKRLTLAEGEDA